MASIGRNIEVGIQAMLKVSEDVADLQALLNKATNDLNMLETLFSVSKYIGLNPQQHIMMSVLEDSIKGVFGASYCQVMFDKDKTHMSHSKNLYNHIDYHDLKEAVSDILIIDGVSDSTITSLDNGSLIVVKLAVGEELYGFLVCHWAVAHNLSESSILFLQIISNQVSMFLKSNALIEEFKALAVIDPLTNIYNRSYFINIEENTVPVIGDSIIMFDIDHFKKVNDSMGHQFGDKILVEFAEILTDVSEKNNGTAFKYGGEEFIIKCSGTEAKAKAIAETVRTLFTKQTGYTVSAGIGTLGTSSKVATFNHLLKQADSALYVSKQTGRDKTTLSSGDIQVLKESSSTLTKLISKSYRQRTPFSIFRVLVRDQMAMTEEDFENFKTSVSSLSRLYDELFVTDSLDMMIIIEGKIDDELYEKRIKEKLDLDLKGVNYDIYCMKDVYDEVILHSIRVSEMVQILGVEMGLEPNEVTQLKTAVEWHDIGKLCIDPEIYTKKSDLDDEEYEAIKLHAWLSYSNAMDSPSMKKLSPWILYHHENYNGSGYYKMKGREIPFEAQLIGIVDKFDALTIERGHREAYSWQEALDILKENKDQFSIDILIKFSNMIINMMQA